LPSGEAYIRFDGFKNSVIKEFQEAIEKYRKAPGVIIDLATTAEARSDVLTAIPDNFLDS